VEKPDRPAASPRPLAHTSSEPSATSREYFSGGSRLSGTLRAGEDAAAAVTGTAGAVAGAVAGGVIGGVSGAVRGVNQGLGIGARSTPAAVLTLAGLGAAGLVAGPILLLVGGTALALRQRRNNPAMPTKNPDSEPETRAGRTRATKATNRTAQTAPRKSVSPGKASAPRATS
jgi:hypothetical protein